MCSLDKTIVLETDSQELCDYFKNDDYVMETIPSFFVSSESSNPLFKIKIINTKEKGSIDLNFDNKLCTINVDLSKLYKPDLVYLILQIFARLHEENNTYIIHAAAVNYKNSSIVLPGVPGSGKTGVTFALLRSGGKYLSNDRAIIRFSDGVPYVVGGTTCMHVRVPTIKEFLKRDIDLPDNINKEDWNTKILLSKKKIDEMGFKQGEPAILKLIVFPKIIMGSEEVKFKEPDNTTKILDLFGVFSEHVRAPSSVFITLNWSFKSLDNENLAQKRLNYVNSVIAQTKIAKATGNVDQIKNEIINILEVRNK